MIEQAVDELAPLIGTRPACRALGAAPATIYRRRRPPEPRPRQPARAPARALSEPERQAVLTELHSERFVDCSPAAVWATLLDEGRYLASQRTMYRLLAAEHGCVRERRDQLAHPAYQRPERLAECCRPLQSRMGRSPAVMIGEDASVTKMSTGYSAVTSVIAARAEDSSTIAFLSA